MTSSSRWILSSALLLLVVGALAALTFDSDGDVTEPDPSSAPEQAVPVPATTPPNTAAAPGFPAIVDTGEVRALRTPGGLVLPVVDGGPGAWEVMTPCAATTAATGIPVHGAHVVLDPGHGGGEPGAVGPSGLTEKELNLDVARRTRALLEAEGISVVLTRDHDIRMTLATRTAIARAVQPLAFVSIHHNAGPIGTSATPASELYHQLADPQSKRLAGLLWEELHARFTPFGTDWAVGDQPGARARRSVLSGDDFYGILRGAEGVPTVLAEAAYLSNPAENALLETAEFRDAEARAIADAILRLVRTDDPGSGHVPTKEAATPAGGGGGPTGCVDPPLG